MVPRFTHSDYGLHFKLGMKTELAVSNQGPKTGWLLEDNINIGVTPCNLSVSVPWVKLGIIQFTTFVCFYPDKSFWFIEEIEQQWSCRCRKSKTGGEILVRIDLGEKTSLVPFSFFLFLEFPVNCFTLTLDSVPSFDKSGVQYLKFGGWGFW